MTIETDFPAFAAGEARFGLPATVRADRPTATSICLRYPTRLNAMALDSSKIVPTGGGYLAGELLFVSSLTRTVEVALTDGDAPVEIAPDCAQPVLAKHAALLMRRALGIQGTLRVHVTGQDLPSHIGLGSSSGTIAAVATAVNRLYGSPVPPVDLVAYLARNHGEEIDGESDLLLPVQCLGGSATAGVLPGAVHVVAGANVPILSARLPEDMSIVLAMPEDLLDRDAVASLSAEAESFDGFAEVGKVHGPEIAYRLLHEAWPSLVGGDLLPLGRLLFDYRFRMGSIDNCAFSHPRLRSIAAAVEPMFLDGEVEVLSLSSVGPSFFAVTSDTQRCVARFTEAGLRTIVSRPWNDGAVEVGGEPR